MRIQFVLMFLVLLALGGCSSVSPVTPLMENVSGSASLDKALRDIVDAGVTPGLVVTVVKGDEIVYASAIGAANDENSRPPASTSGLNLWSISKVFTQLTVLELAADGMLDLDAPVCAYTGWLSAALVCCRR